MADNHTIARPYARAVFDVARETGAVKALSASLGVAREMLADGQVEKFLANPELGDAARLKFLQEMFAETEGASSLLAGGNEHGTNFLKLLLEYDRVGVLPEIADRFDALKATLENTVDVIVTSATALNASQQQEIRAALEQRLGRSVNLATEIDENLIGGAVIRAGDVVIDGSVRARLEGLSNALIA